MHQEGQKLAKLVEAQTPDRPIPIISFVARQRDLSELIGDAVPGADRLNFGDALEALGRAVPQDHPGRPQPAGHRREARPQGQERGRPARSSTRRSTRPGSIRDARDEHPAHARGRPGDVPQGLPVQPRPGADADRRLERASARADGPQGHDAAAGRPSRDARRSATSSRSATCSTSSPTATRRSARRWRSTSTTPSGSITRSSCRCSKSSTAAREELEKLPYDDPKRVGVSERRPAGEDAACSRPSCPRSSRSGR